MKKFNEGAEIGLCRDDLAKLIEYGLNNRILGNLVDDHEVTEITLHPRNKYAIKITIKPMKRDRTNE